MARSFHWSVSQFVVLSAAVPLHPVVLLLAASFLCARKFFETFLCVESLSTSNGEVTRARIIHFLSDNPTR